MREYLEVLATMGVLPAAAVLQSGVSQPIGKEPPKWLSRAIARWSAPRECFQSSRRLVGQLVRHHPELAYVEGYAIPPRAGGIPVHHGWLTYQGAFYEVVWRQPGTEYLGVVVPLEVALLSRRHPGCRALSVLDDFCGPNHYLLGLPGVMEAWIKFQKRLLQSVGFRDRAAP